MAEKDVEGGPEAAEGDVARDGQASADELARRRAGRNGSSINDRARDGEPEIGEEDDGQQLFVWEQGKKVTLGNLIPRGIPVETAFVFGSKRQKGAGGIVGLDDDAVIIVRLKAAGPRIVATRDADETITKVVIENHLTPKVIAAADSAAAEELLRPFGFTRVAGSDAAGSSSG